MKDTKVKDVMVKDVVTVTPYTPLIGVLELFRETHFRCFPVVEESRFRGMICLKDVIKIFYPYLSTIEKYRGLMPFYKGDLENDILNAEVEPELLALLLVEDIMDFNPQTVDENESLEEAYKLLKRSNTPILPVIRDSNILVGVIGYFDIIYYLLKERDT